MLHTQPSRIDNTDLINFNDTQIWLLEAGRIRSVWKAPPLSNPSNRKDVVESPIEGFQCFFESCALRVPICNIDLGGPDALIITFIKRFREVFEAFGIKVGNKDFDPVFTVSEELGMLYFVSLLWTHTLCQPTWL
jgi:hypothetical protein